MPDDESAFHVRASDRADASHVVTAAGPEDAAILFLERWGPVGEDQARLVVTDLKTGASHCFVVDLGAGEIEPC